jgi:hypothetical protein
MNDSTLPLDAERTAAREAPAAADRLVVALLGLGALACVLIVLPYRSFDLDRFLVPKELALHITVLLTATIVLARAKRLEFDAASLLLIAYVVATILSAVFAQNGWLAVRATQLTISGALAFAVGRHLQRAGLSGGAARVLAAVVTVGAITALLQAYGVKMEWAAMSRAPGGTFGNRNFMAHLAAAGVPLLFYCIATARGWTTAALWSAALAICAGALVLSRTRASWLALMAWGALAVILVLRGPALFEVPGAKLRSSIAVIATVLGVVGALLIPNRLDWKSDNPYLESVTGVVNYKEGSGAGRLRQYQNSARMAFATPLLGVGAGNWPVMYPKFAPSGDPSMSETTGMTANPWPSSDWVAALSERGVAALLMLAAFVAVLLLTAWRVRYDSAYSPTQRLAAIAGASVLLIASVEGVFDAVMLLPINALVVMVVAGALIPAGFARKSAAPGAAGRAFAGGAVMIFAAATTAQSAGRLDAMRIYTSGNFEAAAGRDPGNFRIRVRAAEAALGRGDRKRGCPHALTAKGMFPSSPAAARIGGGCRSR